MSYNFSITGVTTSDKLFGNLSNVSIANAFRNIGKHFEDVAIGSVSEVVTVNAGPVKATGSIVIATGNMSASDTIVINSVTITAETSGATGNQFNLGSSAFLTAVNLNAFINANGATLGVTSVLSNGPSTSTTLTLTAIAAGTAANVTITQSGSNVTVTGMTGGANGPAVATSTFTFASTGPTNNETCTVANVTFTAKTSGATGNQFNISSTPSTVAANFAAAINASTSLIGIVTASVSSGVVTLTSVLPGTIGNGIETGVGTLANTTVVAFAGGTNAVYTTLHKGI